MPPVSVDPPCFWDLFSPLGSHKESMKDLRETCIALLKNDSLRQRSCGFAFFTACLSIWSSWGYLAIKKFWSSRQAKNYSWYDPEREKTPFWEMGTSVLYNFGGAKLRSAWVCSHHRSLKMFNKVPLNVEKVHSSIRMHNVTLISCYVVDLLLYQAFFTIW